MFGVELHGLVLEWSSLGRHCVLALSLILIFEKFNLVRNTPFQVFLFQSNANKLLCHLLLNLLSWKSILNSCLLLFLYSHVPVLHCM